MREHKNLFSIFSQAGVSWFTATHVANWVVTLNEKEKQIRERLNLNWTAILDLALKNLHKSLWVGILEYKEESLELLHYQTGI